MPPDHGLGKPPNAIATRVVSPAARPREAMGDALRGLAIIAVVLLHSSWPHGKFTDPALNAWNDAYSVIACQFVDFAVPLFVMLSGYYNAQASCSCAAEYGRFLYRRGLRVLGPYLFWSTVLFGYDVATGAAEPTFLRVAYVYLTGRASYPFFFMIMIMQCYVLMPLLLAGARKSPAKFLVGVWILWALWFVLLYYFRLNDDPRLARFARNPFFNLPCLTWLSLFGLGLVVGRYREKWFPVLQRHRGKLLLAWLATLFVSLGEGMLAYEVFGDRLWGVAQEKYSSIICTVFWALLWMSFGTPEERWPHWLIFLGRISFGIYLIHATVLNGVRELLVLESIPQWLQLHPMYQVACGALTVGLSVVIIIVVSPLVPRTIGRNVLGFVP